MALQSEGDQLAAAWRALHSSANKHGWQAIDIASTQLYAVMAGRRGPGNEESLLVGISGARAESDAQLPRGLGFAVKQTELPGDQRGLTWIVLTRQQGGQLPLFTMMAADLVSLLKKSPAESGDTVYALLIARIRAWQHFMSRDRLHLLTAEEEVGLFGELIVLGDLLAGGISESDALDAWVGPNGGLHDFIIGTGGIETKATAAPTGFIARIASLDQLDDSVVHPLYVGAVRLGQADTGRRLPDLVDDLMNTMGGCGLSGPFISKLTSVGYLDAMREHYSRRFLCRELTYRLVEEKSPRLVRSTVPSLILEARYSVDLDAFPIVAQSFELISKNLGIQKQWN